MNSPKRNGAPATATAKKQVGSANRSSSSEGITFSSVILRALENRPTNEDRIRGPCDQTWPGAESTEVEAEGGEA